MKEVDSNHPSRYFTDNSIEIHQIPKLSESIVVESCFESDAIQFSDLAEKRCSERDIVQSECNSFTKSTHNDDGGSSAPSNVQNVLLVTRPSQLYA